METKKKIVKNIHIDNYVNSITIQGKTYRFDPETFMIRVGHDGAEVSLQKIWKFIEDLMNSDVIDSIVEKRIDDYRYNQNFEYDERDQ